MRLHLGSLGTSPTIFQPKSFLKFSISKTQVPEMVGMFQKEVAERLVAAPGGKQYGLSTVLCRAFYDIEILFNVSPHVFQTKT